MLTATPGPGPNRPEPGFYMGDDETTYYVGSAGVWMFVPGPRSQLSRAQLPAGARRFESGLPSMLLQVALHLELIPGPPLSEDAMDLLDEIYWDGNFTAELPPETWEDFRRHGIDADLPTLLSELRDAMVRTC